MKMTMAPMDQIRQDSLEKLRRRHESLHGLRGRDDPKKGDGGTRRDTGSGGGGGSGLGSNGNENGSGNGNGDFGKGGGIGNGNNDSPFKGSDNSSSRKAGSTDNPPDPPSKPTEDLQQTPSATTVLAPATSTTSPTSTTPTPVSSLKPLGYALLILTDVYLSILSNNNFILGRSNIYNTNLSRYFKSAEEWT
jgi:hypothetical protein